tara:strand:- start:188 stop:580 length:393 start_codon:yes stop_codon:yes gene_type:complete
MEAEAYLKGNGFIFRDWEDNLKQEAKKMANNNTKLEEEELEERTKRDAPERVGGRDTGGRRVKPLEEDEEAEGEELEEGEVPAGLKAYQDKKKGKESGDETDEDDPVNENWFKGNKDDLLFERLVEKWCK